MLAIVVDRFGILVQVESGEASRPYGEAGVGRIGHAQVVEEDVALRLVELVFAPGVLLVHGTAPGEQSRDPFPAAMRHFQQMVATPHQVDEGPAEERLVEIVGAAAAETIIVGAAAAETLVPV